MNAGDLRTSILVWLVPAAVAALVAATHRASLSPGALAVLPPLGLGLLALEARRRHLARLTKELRAIQLPLLGLFVGPALAALVQHPEVGALLFAFLAPLTVAASVGAELEPSTWTAWWLQPRSCRALLLEKLAVVAAALLLGLLQLGLLATAGWQLELGAVAVLMALTAVPLFTLALRHALAGGLIGIAFGTNLVGAFRSFGDPKHATLFGFAERPSWQVFALALALSGACGALTFAKLPELIAGPPERSTGLRWRSSRGVRPMWRALVRKELRLQLTTFIVAGTGLVLPLVAAWAGAGVVLEPLAIFLGMVGGALAGICAVAGEHRCGMALADAASAPLDVLWRTKLLVAGGVALTVGIGLPLAEMGAVHGLAHAAEGWTNHSTDVLNSSGLILLAGWMAVVLGLAAVGLTVSAVWHDLTRAFVGTLVVGAGLLALVAAPMTAAPWAAELVYWRIEPHRMSPLFALPNLHVDEALAQRLMALLIVVPALAACALALRQARRSWPSGRLAVRWQPFAALVATGFVTGLAIFGLGLVRWYSAVG